MKIPSCLPRFAQLTGCTVAVLLLAPALARADQSLVAVSTGYYDLPQGTIPGDLALPSPWINSPNTTFFGDANLATSSDPDEDAILLRNLGSSPVVLSALNIGGAFNLFALDGISGPVSLLAGQNYIFQGVDGSDLSFNSYVSLTLDGQAYQYTDLVDPVDYPSGVLHGYPTPSNETVPWTVIYAPTPTTPGVPETSSTLLLITVALGGLGFARRPRLA
jgi:hypothetical protein